MQHLVSIEDTGTACSIFGPETLKMHGLAVVYEFNSSMSLVNPSNALCAIP